jgi:hypothetical protein
MAKEQSHVVTLDDVPSNRAVSTQKDIAPVVAETTVAGKNHDDALSGERITVTFYEQETDLGKLPVTVGLNGITYQMPRNVPCNIPVEVLGVIKDAVEEVFEANGATVTKRSRPRFSYQVHA